MLVDIEIASIYDHGPLPRGLARCAPDTRVAIFSLAHAMNNRGRKLRVSDLFRSREYQREAHNQWLMGRKRAYSPPPGGSLHEAGRAMDIDLGATGMPLADFWKMAAEFGFTPAIDVPDARLPKAWHFDHRGSHGAVFEYVRSGKAGGKLSPYRQMAISAALAAGVEVDGCGDRTIAELQSGLIRLGHDPGPIDGIVGPRTRLAAVHFGAALELACNRVEAELRIRWPQEFAAG
jgi:hypothetical protein